MAKLTHAQFEAIAGCCIDTKRDSLTFMQAIEYAARREAFKEAVEFIRNWDWGHCADLDEALLALAEKEGV